jgi:fructokinase
MSLPEQHRPIHITVAGEALVDLVMRSDASLSPCPGGASFNLSRALARQGMGVAYLNPLSRDRFGREMSAALVREGVFLAHGQAVPEPTSLAVVHLDERGHPEYAFYRQGVADRAITTQALISASLQLQQVQMVCWGCLALTPDDASIYLPWISQQQQSGRLIVVDINMRPSVVPDLGPYRANVMSAVRFAHIIKASDEDLQYLDAPGSTSLEQANWLLQASGAHILLLTMGAQGAALVFNPSMNQRLVHGRESQAVEVADTIGAGDCFLAGFLACWLDLSQAKGVHAAKLAGMLDDDDKARLLSQALATASINVMRTGCNPPTRAEVMSRLAMSPVDIR